MSAFFEHVGFMYEFSHIALTGVDFYVLCWSKRKLLQQKSLRTVQTTRVDERMYVT